MGKAGKALKAFINEIPDSKLKNFPASGGTVYSDDDFRLDMQGLTTGDPQHYNVQVQVNNQTSISTLKKEKGKTVAKVLVPVDGTMDTDDVRAELHKTAAL